MSAEITATAGVSSVGLGDATFGHESVRQSTLQRDQSSVVHELPSISPEQGSPKFRVVPFMSYERTHFDPKGSLEISDHLVNREYTGRASTYTGELRALARTAEAELPVNVQVNFAIGPWGGNSAYDQVDIVVYGKDGKIEGNDHIWRSIDSYENPLSMVIPRLLRDKLFFARVMHAAHRLADLHSKDPSDPRLFRTRPFDGYVGLW